MQNGMRRRLGSPILAALLALAGAGGLGCGGGEEPASGGPGARPEAPRAKGTNRPPLVTQVRVSPEAPIPGQPLRAEAEASDPDGDPVTLRYEWRVRGARVGGNGAELPLVPAQRGDELELRVTPSDPWSDGETTSLRLPVGNRPPVVTGVAIEPAKRVSVEHDAVAYPRGSDPDGDTVSFAYRWLVNGEEVAAAGEVLETEELRRGDVITLVVVASDGEDESEPFESDPVPVGNAPPRIVSDPREMVVEAGLFAYQVRAEDPDGDTTFRYALNTAPDGMQIDAVVGELRWQPRDDQAGNHLVEVVVDDLQGGQTAQRFSVNVATAEPGSVAPPPPASDEE